MNIEIMVNDAGNEVKNYSDAITFAGNELLKKKYIEPQYIEACIEREKDFPTGLLLSSNIGIAMPHSNSDLVKGNSLSIVRTKNEIEFGRMEDSSQKVQCKLLFNLALSSGQQHLQVLRKLITLFQDEEFIKNFQTLDSEEATVYISKQLIEE